MDEFEAALNRVLSDPAEMEKISRLASRLMGGEGADTEPDTDTEPNPGLAGRLKGMFGADDEKAALVRALSPYLGEERRKKLKKALRLAKAAHIAGVAMREFGGEGGGL